MKLYLTAKMLLSACSLLLLANRCACQVDQEIFDYEDLLAVESGQSEIVNEVFSDGPAIISVIAPAPEGFGGERLTEGTSPKGPGRDAILQEYQNVINEDGSYAFR